MTGCVTGSLKPVGHVRATIRYDSGLVEVVERPNLVLAKGRQALAAGLANSFVDRFDYYIDRMLFGDGGTSGGAPRVVSSNRTGLFGITQLSKPVIASVNPNLPTQVIFTSVVAKADANGSVLNEMALRMANGDLYSMVTFPNLTKAPNMAITYNWRLNFV